MYHLPISNLLIRFPNPGSILKSYKDTDSGNELGTAAKVIQATFAVETIGVHKVKGNLSLNEILEAIDKYME